MKTRHYDVAIVGAGCAGAAAALALRRLYPDLSVALIAPISLSRQVALVEVVHPRAWPLLRALGLYERVFETASPGAKSAQRAKAAAPEPFLIERSALDSLLLESARSAGAECWRSRAVRVEAGQGVFHISLEHELQLDADFLMDATGRRSVVGTALGARRVHFDEGLGVACFFESAADAPLGRWLEPVPEGYWYACSTPTASVVALLTDRAQLRELGVTRAQEFWRRFRSTKLAARLAFGRLTEGPVPFPTSASALAPAGGSGWIAIGDAALSLEAQCETGVFRALHHAFKSAHVAADFQRYRASGERHPQAILQETEEYLGLRALDYRKQSRFSGAPFWRGRSEVLVPKVSTVLRRREAPASAQFRMHLPTDTLKALAELAGQGRTIAELLVIARKQGIRASEQRIRLALDYLRQQGVLVAEEPESVVSPLSSRVSTTCPSQLPGEHRDAEAKPA